ncbi:MAG: hypothetical protein EBZ77_15535, partial [Chitinophagia bacterium]|nr:hypothetical protein [Chitinophagia bacterium]
MNFTPATPAPTGYLVVRSTAPLTGTPTDGIIYTSGVAVGTGISIGTFTSAPINLTGLTANTRYYFTLFPYNGYPSCTGGPLYITTGALNDSTTTCMPVPTLNAATSITSSGATVSYSVVSGATGYQLSVATDSTFTGMISGSPFTLTSGTTSTALTGLNMNTRYYYRVITTGGSCNSDNSATRSFITTCSNPTLSLSLSNPTICYNDDTAITVSGAGAGATYTWSPSYGLSLSSGGSVASVVPSTTTVYTVTGTNAFGCSSTISTTVTVNGQPNGLLVTRALDTICAGSKVLTISGTDTVLNETFDGSYLTNGWSVNLESGLSGVAFAQRSDGFAMHTSTLYSRTGGGKFMVADGSQGVVGSTSTTNLISPSFSLAGLSSATLTWDDFWDNDGIYDLAKEIDLSTNGGASYVAIVNPLTAATIGGSRTLNA